MGQVDVSDAFSPGRKRQLFLMRLRSAAEDPGATATKLPIPSSCINSFPVSQLYIVTNIWYFLTILGTAETSAAAWCSALFQALPLYTDLASQRAVLGVLRVALRNETFLKTFAATLMRTDGAKISRQESFMLFLWSSAAIQALELPAALKGAQKLMERQVRLSTPLYRMHKNEVAYASLMPREANSSTVQVGHM